MGKGEATREAILEHAVGLARRVGLEGLTIGRLADDLDLSKSGLFAHFKSKEALQVQVLDAAAARFVEMVVRPALEVLAAKRACARCSTTGSTWEQRPGGCVFVQAAVDLDDRDGPARDRLVQLQRDWLEAMATTAARRDPRRPVPVRRRRRLSSRTISTASSSPTTMRRGCSATPTPKSAPAPRSRRWFAPPARPAAAEATQGRTRHVMRTPK